MWIMKIIMMRSTSKFQGKTTLLLLNSQMISFEVYKLKVQQRKNDVICKHVCLVFTNDEALFSSYFWTEQKAFKRAYDMKFFSIKSFIHLHVNNIPLASQFNKLFTMVFSCIVMRIERWKLLIFKRKCFCVLQIFMKQQTVEKSSDISLFGFINLQRVMK